MASDATDCLPDGLDDLPECFRPFVVTDQPPPPQPSGPNSDGRPEISLAGTLDQQERATLATLNLNNDPPHVYKRSRQLVRTVADGGQVVLEAFNPASLRAICSEGMR